MKARLIGFTIVMIVLGALFVLTGGDTSSKQPTQPLNTQPQTKFNF